MQNTTSQSILRLYLLAEKLPSFTTAVFSERGRNCSLLFVIMTAILPGEERLLKKAPRPGQAMVNQMEKHSAASCSSQRGSPASWA